METSEQADKAGVLDTLIKYIDAKSLQTLDLGDYKDNVQKIVRNAATDNFYREILKRVPSPPYYNPKIKTPQNLKERRAPIQQPMYEFLYDVFKHYDYDVLPTETKYRLLRAWFNNWLVKAPQATENVTTEINGDNVKVYTVEEINDTIKFMSDYVHGANTERKQRDIYDVPGFEDWWKQKRNIVQAKRGAGSGYKAERNLKIYQDWEDGVSREELAAEHGISVNRIDAIIKREALNQFGREEM